MMEDGDIGKDASEQDNHSAARLAVSHQGLLLPFEPRPLI